MKRLGPRGLRVSHTTIPSWVVHYVPEFEKQ
jgi:transposase-like protein